MIKCYRGVTGECNREARWEVRDAKSFSPPKFPCTLHLIGALRTATTRRGLNDYPRATVGRL